MSSPPPLPENLIRKKWKEAAEPENLIPEKWKEAAEEITLTKKEKRGMAHHLNIGTRSTRQRKQPPLIDVEEYRANRDLKLSQLNPVVLDDPTEFPPEKSASGPTLNSGRAAPRNPRLGLGLGGGCMKDVSDFFASGDYMLREMNHNKKKQGCKLFTEEEKVILNKFIPNLAEATSSKWMPLHTLAASGELYLSDILLKHNVNINAVDKDGLASIHRAVTCNKKVIVNYLLRNSANPFARDKDGATLIHYAVQTGSIQIIKILLLYNVDINLQDNDAWTPLHLAVQTQRYDMVRFLLIKGADRTIKNQDGLTPLDLCLYSGQGIRTYELIKLLKETLEPKSKDS